MAYAVFNFIRAILFVIVLVFLTMLALAMLFYIAGVLAKILGADKTATYLWELQEAVWLRVKIWFFRYKVKV